MPKNTCNSMIQRKRGSPAAAHHAVDTNEQARRNPQDYQILFQPATSAALIRRRFTGSPCFCRLPVLRVVRPTRLEASDALPKGAAVAGIRGRQLPESGGGSCRNPPCFTEFSLPENSRIFAFAGNRLIVRLIIWRFPRGGLADQIGFGSANG